VGDTLTIFFDIDTNSILSNVTTGGHAGGTMDGWFNLTAGTFGDGTYSVAWLDAKRLQITVSTVGTASIPLGDTLTILVAADIMNLAETSPASTDFDTVGGDWGATPAPQIVSITADDPDDEDDVLSDGDTLTIVFDMDTNTPAVGTRAEIDNLVSFGVQSLGTDYMGTWNGTLNTLQITLVDATGGNLVTTDIITIKAGGNLKNAAETSAASTASAAVGGDWGVIDAALEGWWKLDETTGTDAADSSGNDRNGTLMVAGFDFDTDKAQGVLGGALGFDGTGYVSVTGATAYQGVLGKNPRTVAAWIKKPDGGATGPIVTWGTNLPGGKWEVKLRNEGMLRLSNGDGNIEGTALIDDDTWHHIAVVVPDMVDPELNHVVFYIDGKLEAHDASTSPIDTPADVDVMIGEYFGAAPLQGALDDVRIYSRELSATEVEELYLLGAGTKVFVNELHYDNASTDQDEGVEIAGPAGTDLTGWSVVLYNGNTTAVYLASPTITLSGTIPNQQNGFGTLWFPPLDQLQNGDAGGTVPDGLALLDNTSTVIQFLSYEGSFTATDGPANGMTSVDIVVMEDNPVPAIGDSLQLTGTGRYYEDFTWQGPVPHTRAAVNTSQTLQP
jgi:hypothetical protein